MKLKDCREAYYDFSRKASDVSRHLAFAGIGLIWIFKVDGSPFPVLPQGLIKPTGIFAASLFLDLLHYFVAAITWGSYHRYREKRPLLEDDFRAPSWLNWPATYFFFPFKIILVLCAYGFIFLFIIGVWQEPKL